MNIISIQSQVAYGHVGNSAAVFVLQRLGHDVWPIHTLTFSNHPGHGRWRGRIADAAELDDLVAGLEDLGLLAACNGVLSGYVGTRDNAAAVRRAVAAVKRAHPGAPYCCDPVLGDHGRLYVPADVAAAVAADLVPAADLLTPNLFELGFLTDRRIVTRDHLVAALDAIHARGPNVVLVTSADLDTTPAGSIDCVVSVPEGRFCARTPRLDTKVHGTGDAIAALFFAQWLATGAAVAALSHAVSALHGVLRATAAAAAPELLLVAAQDELVSPSDRVTAVPF